MIHFLEGSRFAAANAIYLKVGYRCDSSNSSPSASDPESLSPALVKLTNFQM